MAHGRGGSRERLVRAVEAGNPRGGSSIPPHSGLLPAPASPDNTLETSPRPGASPPGRAPLVGRWLQVGPAYRRDFLSGAPRSRAPRCFLQGTCCERNSLGTGLPAAGLAAYLVRTERGHQLREGCMWFSRIPGGRTGPEGGEYAELTMGC